METKQFNILIVCNSLSSGGGEKRLTDVSLQLKDHNVFLWPIRHIEEKFDHYGTVIDCEHTLENMSNIKKQYKIDLTITTNFVSSFFSIRTNTPDKTIIDFPSYVPFLDEHRQDRYTLVLNIIQRADCVVAVSRKIALKLEEYECKSIIVSPYAPDIDEIIEKQKEPIPKNLKPIFDKPTIINVGRYCQKAKDQQSLIELSRKIKDAARIVFVGMDRGHKQVLIDLAKERGLKVFVEGDVVEDQDVYFLDFTFNPFNLIAASTIFFLSSLWEGMPGVLIETLLCPTHIISTDCCSGPRELLTGNIDCNIATNVEHYEMGSLVPLSSHSNYLQYWQQAVMDRLNEPQPDTQKRTEYIRDLNKVKLIDVVNNVIDGVKYTDGN